MTNDEKYTLCGGTFLTLLLQARKVRTGPRKNAIGESDGMSDSELFAGLIKVLMPNFEVPKGRSFVTYTSSYKACNLSSNDTLPFDRKNLIDKFREDMETDYLSVLRRMSDFTEKFIDEENNGKWLVCALLETIDKDDSIVNEPFYVDSIGQRYTKQKLLKMQKIEFQPFLLGIWQFILVYRPDNSVGKNTLVIWHDRGGATRSRKHFISTVGSNWKMPIDVVPVTYETMEEEKENLDRYVVPSNMDALLLPGGIAPELTEEAPWILLPKGILPSISDFSTYLENAHDKYSLMKTLLYNDSPHEFYDFYVCNDINQRIYEKKFSYKIHTIHDATVKDLSECSNFVLITGTGGLGKSMMMRHLLLSAIDDYDERGMLPIFIPLKDYDDTYRNLLEYIYDKYEGLGGIGNMKEFSELLEDGTCLLLFDGLDEIKSDYRKSFELQLDRFADKYTKNMFVMSSRPIGAFVSLHRFTVLNLCPFTKAQALDRQA